MNALAEFLDAQGEAVVELFARRMQGTPVAAARRGLVHGVPELLRSVIRALQEDARPLEGMAAKEGTADDRKASRLGFDVNGVVREYGLLRDCVFELLETADVRPAVRLMT